MTGEEGSVTVQRMPAPGSCHCAARTGLAPASCVVVRPNRPILTWPKHPPSYSEMEMLMQCVSLMLCISE